MKKFLKKLIEIMALLKVGAVTLGAFYLFFWFYRFFELPFYDIIALVLDFPNNMIPWPIETISMYKGHVVQNAYFIDGVLCVIISFIFGILEKISYELQRRNNIREVNAKHKLEKKVNEELEKSYLRDIYGYDYFSIYIKYKVKYISAILSSSNPYTTESITARSYDLTFDFVKKSLQNLKIIQNKDSVFIYGNHFANFEEIIVKILGMIKSIKRNNANAYMETDFLIVCDANKTEQGALNSYQNLNIMAGYEYYGKAITTTAFKTRFDLLNSQRFIVEILGFATGNKKISTGDTDIYTLKSKPQQF